MPVQVDLRLAAEVEEVDLVVGGHSHSFLYSGELLPEMVEEVQGAYQTIPYRTTSRPQYTMTHHAPDHLPPG